MTQKMRPKNPQNFSFDPDDWEWEETSCAIVEAKQPLLDWIKRLPDRNGQLLSTLTLEEINDSPNVFLIPDFDFPEAAESYIKNFKKKIFANELHAWDMDPANWPQISIELFDLWFHIKFAPTVIDLEYNQALENEPEFFQNIPDDYR